MNKKWIVGVLCLWIYSSWYGVSFAETGEVETLRERVGKLESSVEQRERELGELRAIVQELKGTLNRLQQPTASLQQPTASVLEPAEELKRVAEYVCQHGHLSEAPPADGRCPLDGTRVVVRETYKKIKFARREHVAEKIEATIEEALARRIVVGATATGAIQQTLGAEPSDRNVGVGSTDLLFVGRPAPSATLFADLEAKGGNGLDASLGTRVNDRAGSLQDSDGVNRVGLREAWLRWDSPFKQWSAAAGKIDLTNYFDGNGVANDETTQFLASMFVNNPALEQPDNGPGAFLRFDSKEAWRGGIGVQSSDDSGNRLFSELYGIAEVGYYTNILFGHPGNYRLWGRFKGAMSDNPGLGVSLDQELFAGWTAFGRYGVAERDGAAVKDAWSVGIEQKAPWSSRARDRWAIALGQQDSTTTSRDSLLEWYYRFVVTPNLALSPHLQWLIESAGTETAPTQEHVVVIGLRAQANF